MLVRSDNTTAVAYINHQGGSTLAPVVAARPPPLDMESEAPEVPSCSYIPGDRNWAADELSRVRPISGEWRLHPQSVQLIWDQFGEAQLDLFASRDSSHCAQFIL